MQVRSLIVSCLSAALALVLAGPVPAQITARTAELALEGAYLPVDLNAVANDTQAAQFPADRVQWNAIPFDLAKKGAANCLFLKPIGWKNVKNEDAEYPSYIANYDSWWTATNDPARALVRVPVGDYKAVWLLAASDNDTNLSDSVTFRLGLADGQGPVRWHDFSARVPRANATAGGPGVQGTMATAAGNLYLVRVPFGQAIAQDYRMVRTLVLDFTKELRVAINLPDPNRFQLRPLGVPSGVRLYGVTLERAALQLEVTAAEPGNVFNEPQVPTFKLDMVNVLGEHWIPYSIATVATADDGTVVRQVVSNAFRSVAWVYGNPVLHHTVTVPVPKRGQYRLQVSLLAQGDVVISRETTFAVLAPDTRKYRDESPWGTWDFAGGHVTPNDPDVRGPLYVKAGLRYGMGDQPEAVRQKYGLLTGADARLHGTNDLGWIRDQAKEQGTPLPKRLLIFHETGVSGAHLTRTPDLFTGRAPYKFNADEEKTFKAIWAEADEAERTAIKEFPQAEIYIVTGAPRASAMPGRTSAPNPPTSPTPR